MQNEKSYSLEGRKIMLGLPTYDFKMSAKLAIALANFAATAGQHGVSIKISNISGCSIVARARNLIANDFLESDCTDLMFIDSDINFNSDDIFRLMAWVTEPKIGIAGGIPTTRSKEKTFISTLYKDENGELIMNRMGLIRAKQIATAFMLIRRDVFETLDKAHPEWDYTDARAQNKKVKAFFHFDVTPQGYVGEDYLFCNRASEHGFEVWVDPTITLGHMGMEEFTGCFGEDWLYPRLRSLETNQQAA
jgi:hypothetical protein